MSEIRRKGDKSRYSVCDDKCIGRECLQLGHYQVRGASMSGSRATGDMSPCCMRRAYHGCPNNKDAEYSAELERSRKKEGYKNG